MKQTTPKQDSKLETVVNGCKVTLHFASRPNPQLAPQIKLALLGTVSPKAEEA